MIANFEGIFYSLFSVFFQEQIYTLIYTVSIGLLLSSLREKRCLRSPTLPSEKGNARHFQVVFEDKPLDRNLPFFSLFKPVHYTFILIY